MILAELIQLKKRIDELNNLAWQIDSSARLLKAGNQVQPLFSETVQRWYRGARELLAQNSFSGLKEFESCYEYWVDSKRTMRAHTDIEQFSLLGLSETAIPSAASSFDLFLVLFTKARALITSCIDEVISRELPVKTQLSFEVVADEFQAAQEILDSTSAEPTDSSEWSRCTSST